jgi:uncharacterized protein
MPEPRGWRFVGLDAPGGLRPGAAGPAVTAAGGIRMVEGDAAVRQSLALLLVTAPGERVMRPDYGCPLHRLMFAPNDATTAGLAIHYVREAVRRWEPRVEILRLDAGADPLGEAAASTLFVWLAYRVRVSQRDDLLTLSLDLGEGAV